MFNGIYKNPNNNIGRNIARSFPPLIYSPLRLEKTGKLHFVDKCKRDGGMKTNLETDPGEYCAKHKTFPFFFSSRNCWPKRVHPLGFSLSALPFRPSIRDPPIRYRRSVFPNTRYIPPPPPFRPESTGEQEGTRGYAVALTHVYTYDFSIGPRDIFPSLRLPLPSLDLLERRNFISYRPRRDPPILIKRISRHQFRVPWSPRDINYGRQYTRRASYVCRFEYRWYHHCTVVAFFFSFFFPLSYDRHTWSTPDQYPIQVEGVFHQYINRCESPRLSNFVPIIRGISR